MQSENISIPIYVECVDQGLLSRIPVSARVPLTIFERLPIIENTYIKIAHVSALTGSVPRKVCTEFQHRAGIGTMSPDSLYSPQPLSHEYISILKNKIVCDSSFSQLSPDFFPAELLKSNIKARQYKTGFLTANLYRYILSRWA